jgi:hypothetical protein
MKPKIYTDYSFVYIDPEIDVVDIGTPYSSYKEQCLAAIAAGKHVLCKKPFTINAAKAEEVISAAKAKGVYILQGNFPPSLPNIPALTTKSVTDAFLPSCPWPQEDVTRGKNNWRN